MKQAMSTLGLEFKMLEVRAPLVLTNVMDDLSLGDGAVGVFPDSPMRVDHPPSDIEHPIPGAVS